MYKRTLFIALIGLLLGANTLFAASRPVSILVGGNFIDVRGGIGSFSGRFDLIEFAAENNQLVAKGFVSGVLTDSTGHVVGSVIRDVKIPVVASSSGSASRAVSLSITPNATCPILHLDLGPLNLNVLGLVVALSPITLDISAESGPGNLLGNLLCTVAHLLDNLNIPGALATLVNLLNQILQAIGNLLG